ncbi:MAG: histone deacetylase [Armatimonadetes bacterium]|nr:histone deacetylase [Armatimonadota bacterium]
MTIALYYDALFLEHDTGAHPEKAIRLTACVDRLAEVGLWDQVEHPNFAPAPWEALTACHDEHYLRFLQQTARRGGGYLTPDTPFGRHSFDAARLASGAAIQAVEAVLDGKFPQAFILSRPPGHHATHNQGMGFCLINHAAVAVRHLVHGRGLERVLIVDFDVHHGNGTQDIFYEDPAVLYISTHQYPAYPATGSLREVGRGAGAGFTVNVPLPAAVGDAGYARIYEQVVAPAARRFRPQFCFISAGYDAHWTDHRYLSSIRMQVSVAGFTAIVRQLRDLAEELCAGRVVFLLEGGYDPTALSGSVLATLNVLLHRPVEDPLGPSPHGWPEPDVGPLIANVREIHDLGTHSRR